MGFDIIVQADSTPFLLEVNSAPSLSVQHQQDLVKMAKEGLEIEVTQISPSVRSIVDEVTIEILKIQLIFRLLKCL